MIRNNNNTKTVLAVLLVGLMVTSMFVPFATMTASADDGDNEDSDGDSQDYTKQYSELVSATERYHNVETVHSQLQSDFFSTSGTVGACTDWVVFDYEDAGRSDQNHYMGIQYCHFKGEIDTAGNDADYGHYWKKDVQFVTASTFEDAKNKMNQQAEEEDEESIMGIWRQFAFGDGNVVKLVAQDDNGNTEVIHDYTDQESKLYEYIGKNVDGISISETTDDTTDTVQEESNELEKWMNDATEQDTDTRGSIVDYSYEDKSPVSIYVSRFKDSGNADELLEERSIPPQYAQGSVDTFGEMTQNGGSAKISGNNGLNVGFAALRVPDAQEGAHIVFETKNGQYPDDVTVKVLTRNGLELQSTDFKRVIELDSSVVEYANNNNAVYYVLTSNGKTVQTFNIECSSVVINSNGKNDDTPQECDTGTIATGATNFNQNQDSNTDSGENSDTSDSNQGASILDYEVDTEYSESVDYVSSYTDGGDLGYMEKTLGLSEPAGTIQGFPNMIDSDASTSATVTAGDNGLNAGFASQNAPFGENHAFVMKYKVIEGQSPDVTVNTLSNSVKISGDQLQADNSVHTMAVDLTREQKLEVSEAINRNGVVVVSLQSEDSSTKMKIYCASVVANANSQQLDCDGSTDDGSAGTLQDAGVVKQDSEISDAPAADDDISAYANVKGQVNTNTQVTLDASYSDAGQGTIQSYEWTVNGNTYRGETATTTFTSAGTYDVKLTVTNNRGETDTTSVPVTVSEPTVTEYTYTTSTTNTQTKEATSSPGSDWVQGDKIGTKNVYKYTESTTSPGSNWEKVKQVDTKTTEKTVTKEQHESPGDGWTKVETVNNVAGGTNSYDFQASQTVSISGEAYWSDRPFSYDHVDSASEFSNEFNSGVSNEGYFNGRIHWHNSMWDSKPSYLPGDGFVWKYEGWVYAPETGTYQFGVDGDDAVDVHVGGQKVASWYGGHGASYYHSGNGVHLDKGWHKLKVRQEEGGGGEGVSVAWQKPGQSGWNVVPDSRIAGSPQSVDKDSVHGQASSSGTQSYSWDFSGGDEGWSSDGSHDAKSGWLTGGCESYEQTNRLSKTVSGTSGDSVEYDVEVAAVDSWDGETLRLQIKDNSGWNTVESTSNTRGGGSHTNYDCSSNSGWVENEFQWSGSYDIDGEFKGIRVTGGIGQDDSDESLAINYADVTVKGGQTQATSEFQSKLSENNGMTFRAQGDYVEFAEAANDGGLKYEMNAPSNGGTVTVDTKFVANSFESSGATLYAVDTDGDRKVIKCDSGVNSIDAPNCDQELGDFTWDGQYEVTMDSEIDRIVLAVDMENSLGRYYDDGRFYHMDVTSAGEDVYKWEKTKTTEEPVYEWRQKTGEEDLYTWTKTTTETTTHNTLTQPDDGVTVVGDVSSETVKCSELSADLQQKSSKCGAEA